MPAARKPKEPEAVPDKLPEGTKVVPVTDEELAMLTNARELKKAVETPPGEANVVVQDRPTQQPETVMLEDERAQREVDLRAINQQILTLRQSLAAGKLNRLLNEKGWLQEGSRQHDKTFRQEIHEMRQILDYLISLKAEMGETGLMEPSLVAIEVPGDGPLVPAS